MAQINLPELGEGINKATVTYWFAKPGDRVNQNDELVELATDKATFNLPSPVSGKLREIIAQEGALVLQGEPLCVIDDDK